VLGGFDSKNYVTKRLYAKGHDGVTIAITIAHKKDVLHHFINIFCQYPDIVFVVQWAPHQKLPAYLYGYGSYSCTEDPVFQSVLVSLMDRDFLVANFHIRGESYYGRPWYEDGKMLKKKNTFLDFISCTQHLINVGYVVPER